MFRIRILILFSLFLIISFTAIAQEIQESPGKTETPRVTEEPAAEENDGDEELDTVEENKANYLNDDFQFTTMAGMQLSSYQWLFTGGFQADFNANPFVGAGLKTTIDYGLLYKNLNINLYALYKVWWFYAGPGISFIVQGMTIPVNDKNDYVTAYTHEGVTSLALTGGMRFPIVRIGPGHMTMDLSIDWYQNDIPLSQTTPPFNGSTIRELIDGATSVFKIGARLGYTF